MLAVYFAQNLTGMPIYGLLELTRAQLMQGQVWRLITFLILPPGGSLIFTLLALYIYYFLGRALENSWGTAKFTLFYITGAVGAVIAALISGSGNNMYLNLSLTLAFAALYPEHQFLLFFVIPVKVKYLAYIEYAVLALSFAAGNWAGRAAIIASLLNMLLFFYDDFIRWLRDTANRIRRRIKYR
jgi:membrane associated rhomboid family serine protease